MDLKTPSAAPTGEDLTEAAAERSATTPTRPAAVAQEPASKRQGLLAGAAAAASALAVGELLAGASRQIPSLIRSVGDVFVDYTPGDLVRTSIENLGSNQKPALLWGIGIAAVVLGALLGRASVRRNTPGVVGFVIFGLVGGWAASRVPLASAGWSWFSALAATAVGLATFVALMALARRSMSAAIDAVSNPALGLAAGSGRRSFLGFAGGAGVFGLFGIGLGRWLTGNQTVENARSELATRLENVETATAEPISAIVNMDDIDGISPLLTPNDSFYRIDTALEVPQLDPNEWFMTIKGMVDNELRFTLDDLLEMEQITSDITLSCVSNDVGGQLVGNARWTGVRLSTLLEMAGVQEGATQIASRSWDDWDCGFPTEVALDGRDCMVALTMNGEPLPIDHGFPARLVIPGLYGYVSATKWLKEIELTTLEDFDGYWIPRGWAKYGPIKTQSRIDVPRVNVTAGQVEAIAGVAWAGIRAISAVEVRVDDGEWMQAELGEELAESTWRQWHLPFMFEPGDHQIQVRATDGTEMTQNEARKPVAPDGAEGYHTVRINSR